MLDDTPDLDFLGSKDFSSWSKKDSVLTLRLDALENLRPRNFLWFKIEDTIEPLLNLDPNVLHRYYDVAESTLFTILISVAIDKLLNDDIEVKSSYNKHAARYSVAIEHYYSINISDINTLIDIGPIFMTYINTLAHFIKDNIKLDNRQLTSVENLHELANPEQYYVFSNSSVIIDDDYIDISLTLVLL